MIVRDLERASARSFDLAVIGGGILGACHALEAARRDLSVLLLERDDFGGATSWASQRIVHGGLRYVQSLDFPRQLESIRERRWFLRSFPEHVRPLPCLMPLYNRGLKRGFAFRAAFLINDGLSFRRNAGLPPRQHVARGSVLSRGETREWFPGVETRGLCGAALWHDGVLDPPQRVLMEILRWAASGGATALNYTNVVGIARDAAQYAVHAEDRTTGQERVFRATHVVNCAGPRAAALHDAVRQGPGLSLAFGLLLDREPLAPAAVAVSPRQSGTPTYFLVPCHDRILAGTVHLPVSTPRAAGPSVEEVDAFLEELNESVPGLGAGRSDVLRVLFGLVPATGREPVILLSRPVRRVHASSTSHSRFFTVWGVKYTTARSTAAGTLQALFPGRRTRSLARPAAVGGLDLSRWTSPSRDKRDECRALVRRIQHEESVLSLDDLLLRRTDWGMLPHAAAETGAEIAAWLDPFPEHAIGASDRSTMQAP